MTLNPQTQTQYHGPLRKLWGTEGVEKDIARQMVSHGTAKYLVDTHGDRLHDDHGRPILVSGDYFIDGKSANAKTGFTQIPSHIVPGSVTAQRFGKLLAGVDDNSVRVKVNDGMLYADHIHTKYGDVNIRADGTGNYPHFGTLPNNPGAVIGDISFAHIDARNPNIGGFKNNAPMEIEAHRHGAMYSLGDTTYKGTRHNSNERLLAITSDQDKSREIREAVRKAVANGKVTVGEAEAIVLLARPNNGTLRERA